MHRLFAAILILCAIPAFAAKQYSYFRVGNQDDVTTSTTPGTVLMGGGTDVDAAFQWMCARSGNGDFLVIRATGTDAYNPYIQQLCPNENSVATLIIPNRDMASDPFVISTIQNAKPFGSPAATNPTTSISGKELRSKPNSTRSSPAAFPSEAPAPA